MKVLLFLGGVVDILVTAGFEVLGILVLIKRKVLTIILPVLAS
jgi:hypothetical protein